MTEQLIRAPTLAERQDFVPLAGVPKGRDAKSSFIAECAKEQQKASKKKLPFADFAAMNDFEDYYKREKELNIRKNGYLKIEDIKSLDVDWAKYSDLKNFEVTEEGDTMDSDLSKKHNVTVMLNWTEYKYKGYKHPIKVMEEPTKAIERARKASAGTK